jgi:RNA polymerase sigma-70 factor (ECF subfamily)
VGRAGDYQAAIDLALIERVGARDERAVGELYDRHSRLLYSLVLRIVRDQGHTEDVLQEVFLAVWTRIHTYNVALGSPVAWLVRIARNRAIDRLRSSDARMRAAQAAQAAPVDFIEQTTPEDRASAGEQWRAAARVLETLPQEQRVLVEDAYFLGLTHAELAARHGLPLGTVKTRIRTGMQTLRQSLTSVSSES